MELKKKPIGMEEFDGYPMPEPRKISDEERAEIMKQVEALRKSARIANNLDEEDKPEQPRSGSESGAK